jgi:hypothetical protein
MPGEGASKTSPPAAGQRERRILKSPVLVTPYAYEIDV